jgi:hypothetical protein
MHFTKGFKVKSMCVALVCKATDEIRNTFLFFKSLGVNKINGLVAAGSKLTNITGFVTRGFSKDAARGPLVIPRRFTLQLAVPWLRRLVAGFHPRGPGSHPRQFMWDLWGTKWQWHGDFTEFFGYPLSILFHCGYPYVYLEGVNNMLAGGRSSET